MIKQSYRNEFEQIGVEDLRKRVAANIFDDEKLKQAREWLDEKDHGETRDFAQEKILRTARSANIRATIALIISSISAAAAIVAIILPHSPKLYFLMRLGWRAVSGH